MMFGGSLNYLEDLIEASSITIHLEHDVIYELINQSCMFEELVSLTNVVDLETNLFFGSLQSHFKCCAVAHETSI